MKIKITLLLLLCTVLILTGCGGSESQPTGPTYKPFVGGTDGVILEFVPQMPPTTPGAILDGGRSSFSIGIKVTNKGEHDLEPGDFVLSLDGIQPATYGVTYADLVQPLTDSIQGSKKLLTGETVQGQFSQIIFEGFSYLDYSYGDWPQNFNARACYKYQTKSSTPICIANDVTSVLMDTSSPICRIDGQKTSHNSGGPVQITNVRQMPQGSNRISLMFDVVHRGNGHIFAPTSSPTNCQTSLQNPHRDKVLVDVYLSDQTASTTQLICTGGFTGPLTPMQATPLTAELMLYQGTPRTVTCTIQETTPSDVQQVLVTDVLFIDLKYNYGQTLPGGFVVKGLGPE